MFISYEMAASLLNFGAFLAFMGVNIAAIRVSGSEKAASGPGRRMKDILFPSAGFLFCLVIWLSLPLPAKIAGGIWFIAGFGFLSVRTRWFRRRPAIVDFT
jgi:amino acid transporter